MTDADCNGCEFDPERYYDPDFQIWLRPEPDGAVSVGMTDLSQTIAGGILHVRVRRPGTRRPAGKPVATIESGKWAGPVPNFFDCVIESANQAVLEDPGVLNRHPYDAWIARVRTDAPVEQVLSGFLHGNTARDAFCARARADNVRCKRAGTGGDA